MRQKLVSALQKAVARSRLGTRAAIKLREQCNSVVGLRCGVGIIDSRLNGEEWLAKIVGPWSKTFIDVGANVGDWSAMFISHMKEPGRGLLYEPAPEATERLRQRFSLPSVEVVGSALSDEEGAETFYVEASCGETSSLVAEHSRLDAVTIEIPVTTLDAEAVRRKIDRVDMLKIDAEGYDMRVLTGAQTLLRSQRIGVVQFEYNSPWAAAGSTLAAAFAMLRKCGYQVFILRGDGLFEFDPRLSGEYYRYSNFSAFSADCFAALPQKSVRGALI